MLVHPKALVVTSRCGSRAVGSRAVSSTPTRYHPASGVRNSLGARPSPKSSPDSPVLRMLMFGKPGAGKGTLSSRLVDKYDISFLSAGDILRQNIADKTEIGRIAEDFVAAGGTPPSRSVGQQAQCMLTVGAGLLPDDVITSVITSKLDVPVYQDRAWILDGFPRTVGQGELLDAHLRNRNMPLTLIVNLDVADDVILSRISDRWVHLPSGRVYNLSYNRPKIDGRDDVTGEPLTKRPDDNPEIFARRLQAFYHQTSPLLAYYASRASSSTKLVTLAGRTSDEIWPQLESLVQQLCRTRSRSESHPRLVAQEAHARADSRGARMGDVS